jgi:hypothetical protein
MKTQEIEQQVGRLYATAQREGCDAPTENMVIDLIATLLDSDMTDTIVSLDQSGYPEASKALENWREIQRLKEQ